MREILFRGKVADEPDEWVYGYLVDKKTIFQHGQHKESKCCGWGSFFVKPDTVGQYTGLEDKNGTKIFEGDIVKGTIVSQWAKEEIVCCVEYQKNSFVCIEQGKWEHKLKFAKNIEVIGNIYDNPELLEDL